MMDFRALAGQRLQSRRTLRGPPLSGAPTGLANGKLDLDRAGAPQAAIKDRMRNAPRLLSGASYVFDFSKAKL